jgi:hypothetical protein
VPAAAEPPVKYDHYLFASFHGGDDGGRNGEQIWLSVSKANDPFNWYELNYDPQTAVSQPVLQTVNPPRGQTGLRDPSLIRSADGEHFYLLATDLKTFQDGQSWSYRQSRGSRNLVVYESDDLVNWSEPRFVKVEDDHAGNVWAPEAFYDAKAGQYIVFWASNLYPNTDVSTRNTSQISYNRIRIATTKDFVTFTEPTTWINLDRSTSQNGWGMIDSTMIATDDRIYRLTKDENGFRVLLQYIDSLDDLHDTWGAEETTPFVTNRNPITALTANPNAWTMVGNPNGSSKWQIPGLNGGNLEGPLVFKDNTEDMWYVFIDYASGGGYVAWRSESMDKPPNEWEYLGQSWCNTTGLSTSCTARSETSPLWSLPVSPRHGSVLPITSEEWEGVMTAYNSPVHVEASVVKADGTVADDGAWVNEVPKLKVKWTDFNGTGLAPAWLQSIEGHNGGPRVISPERITTGIVQGMTLPVNAAEGTNWAQVEYRDASLGGDAVRLWTPDVSYKLDTVAPVLQLPDDVEVLSTSASGAQVNYAVSATDATSGVDGDVACTPTPGSVFPVGTTTVECTAKDNAGNTASGSFDVTVKLAVLSDTTVGGSVPATLALTLGAPASFGPFTPGLSKDYLATTTATVTSTAGDATLTVADPSDTATGHLVNGAFSLPQPLLASGATNATYTPVGGSSAPTTLKTWDGPTTNDSTSVSFKQTIGDRDALRTGAYAKTLTFTLSTTNP